MSYKFIVNVFLMALVWYVIATIWFLLVAVAIMNAVVDRCVDRWWKKQIEYDKGIISQHERSSELTQVN